MLKLLPLGTGNGFTKKFFHSNFLVSFGNQHMLIDAGTTLRYSLEKLNVMPSQITSIFITHFHHDHAGGLAEFLMRCYWENENQVPHRPFLFLRPSQVEDIDGLLAPVLNNQGLTWEDYCHIKIIEDNHFQFDKLEVQIIPTDNLHCSELKSCGIKITDKSRKNIILTGDIKNLTSSNLISYINQHTCAIVQDVSFDANPVHSTYEEVLSYYPVEYHPIIYGVHYEDDYDSYKKYHINFLEEGKPLLLS